ncbi:MAG: hypothetical protein ACKN9V_09695, partial [Pseudomonadota bacterium]
SGIEKGKIFELGSPEVLASSESLGHNIPSDELRGFWEALAKLCSPEQSCASSEENELFENVLIPMSFKRPQFIAITYAFDADWWVAISHELKHAQYFLNSKYRETVDRFWNETVSEEDRERVRTVLGERYNKNDEAVMRNEFQAFLLEMHALEDMLKDFAPLYRDKLIQKLQEVGVDLDFKNSPALSLKIKRTGEEKGYPPFVGDCLTAAIAKLKKRAAAREAVLKKETIKVEEVDDRWYSPSKYVWFSAMMETPEGVEKITVMMQKPFREACF